MNNKSLHPTRMVLVLRQVALMTSAGIPAVTALIMIEKSETDKPIRKAIRRTNQLLKQGIPLSKSLEKSGMITDPMELQILQVGEQTGTINSSLSALADQREDHLAFRGKMMQVLTYPLLIIFIAIGVTALMIFWIVPGFSDSYQAMGVPVPDMMKFLLAVNEFLTSNKVEIILTFIFFVGLSKLISQNTWIKSHIHLFLFQLPVIHSILRITLNYRFCKGLELMLGSGIPLAQSLRIFQRQTVLVQFEREIRELIKGVESGLPMSSIIQHHSTLLPIVSQMVSVGEKTAGLPFILRKTADIIRLEMDTKVRMIGNVAEPVILMVTGLLVGILLLSLYIPLFESMNMIGG